ncbi:serine hydrolase family protein [Deinococcus sp. SDU3-2]|uniref:Serine hydrolase family protein n=1 Tax=Deinococcus terrestris TaxID=2651870 RepID=A0A7X1NZT7_9DEIO|nr:alpha/beta hydrolase [Deinococcus terrestris]MPY68324.1 serine hydrolase family protein [Deinococcus terrestris]
MTPTLVIVPGLGDSGPEHWQTLWERKFGAARVRQDDPEEPDPHAWAARLDEVVRDTPGELVLVAHSCGVPTVAHWAAHFEVPERVRGALLVAPPDPERPNAPEEVRRFAPLPSAPLPFPALVVASENDPYAASKWAEALADTWGAEFVTAGEAGHLNTASGHGDWPDGEVLLSECLHAWTPHPFTRF